MKKPLLIGIVLATASWTLVAQSAAQNSLNLNFPNFSAAAAHKAEVDLDGASLSAIHLADDKSTGLSGVKELHVRHYEFAATGAYKDSDLDPLRQQVASDHSWSPVVRTKEPDQKTDIFVLKGEDGKSAGLLVISAESKQVNVVEALGTVDVNKVKELVDSTIHYDLPADALASGDGPK